MAVSVDIFLARISIHAPREGGDQILACSPALIADFNPRPPRGGRRLTSWNCGRLPIFQSTPPARGATILGQLARMAYPISIHAPREGGDLSISKFKDILNKISIHAPREGGRRQATALRHFPPLFQSTPPARGATILRTTATSMSLFQSTPPARGATLYPFFLSRDMAISIHAPREGGDSTGRQNLGGCNISIHAPREGGDLRAGLVGSAPTIFQSTPPARGATGKHPWGAAEGIFQSTPPARGATSRN